MDSMLKELTSLDLSAYTEDLSSFAAQVSGRVAHIDADFTAYQVACETRDELDGLKPRRTFEEMQQQVVSIVEYQTRLVGAESYVLYITPPASTKGGRADTAVTKEYQGNRKNRVKPEHLDNIRAFMGEALPSKVALDREADDLLCQAMYEAIEEGCPELHVLCSRDKDLNMVPGYYWDYQDEQVMALDGDTFGYIELDRSKKSPKVTGRGTKFFWVQCLMGDGADNIAGLPSYHLDGKNHKCGAVTTYKLLEDAESDLECYNIVRDLYKESKHEWTNYRDNKPTTWGTALYGDMVSLWMCRSSNDSINNFLSEVLQQGN